MLATLLPAAIYRYKLFNLFSVNAHAEARFQLDWFGGCSMWVILVVVVVAVLRVAAAGSASAA